MCKSIKPALVVVILGASVLFVAFLLSRSVTGDVTFLKSALRATGGITVLYQGQSYAVREGRVFLSDVKAELGPDELVSVLRTAYFSELYRRDPLFALDGTDPDLLTESIEALRESADEVAASYPIEKAEVIRRDLYPLRFLSTLPHLQRMRQKFLALPDEEGLGSYQEALAETSGRYVADMQSHAVASEALLGTSASSSKRFAFMDGIITPYLIAVSYKNGVAAARRLDAVIRSDVLCANGVGKCRALSEVTDARPADAKEGEDRTLSRFEKENEYILRTSRRILGNTDDGLVALIPPTPCVEGGTTTLAVLVDETNLGFPRALQIGELQDIHFWDLSSSTRLTPSMAAMRDKGIRYLRQPRLNPYVCYAGTDVFALSATLLAMRGAVRNMPLSEDMNDQALRAEVRKYEKNIADRSRPLSAREVSAYVEMLGAAVAVADGTESGQFHATSTRRLIQERISMWKNKTGNFDMVLRSIAQFNRAVEARKLNVPSWTMEYLFVARTEPRATFLFFNPTVNNDPFVFDSPQPESRQMKLVPYSALRPALSSEELIRGIVASERLFFGL